MNSFEDNHQITDIDEIIKANQHVISLCKSFVELINANIGEDEKSTTNSETQQNGLKVKKEESSTSSNIEKSNVKTQNVKSSELSSDVQQDKIKKSELGERGKEV